LVDQLGQAEQASGGERAATSRDRHERIKRCDIGPPRRQREQLAVRVMHVYAVLTPVLAVRNELEVLPEQRVERVRHSHPAVAILGTGCS